MTAAFLYCGGYLEMISSALFTLSAVNAKGIFGLLYSVSRCMNNASERRAHEFEKALPKTAGVEVAERLNKVVASIVHQRAEV